MSGVMLNWWGGKILRDVFSEKESKICAQCKKNIQGSLSAGLIFALFKNGHCRSCSQFVLWKFPLFGVLGAILALVAWQSIATLATPTPYHIPARIIVYGLLMSGLLLATRTDLQAMVIPQFVLIGLTPVALISASMGLLPVTFATSLLGGACGYGIFWMLSFVTKKVLGKEGMGLGDIELLGVLGLFTGPVGVWAIMLTSSLLGSLSALVYLVVTKQGRDTRMPFGPFLVLGFVVYILCAEQFAYFLLG